MILSNFGIIAWLKLVAACHVIYLLCKKFEKHKQVSHLKQFTNKVVFITGATSGLGKQIAKHFYKLGAKLILSSRSNKKLDQFREELISLDNSKPIPIISQIELNELETIESKVTYIINNYGPVDIVINNGGMSYRGDILSTELNVHQKVMNVNYFAQVAITKAFLHHMIENKKGTIVIISSIQGKIAIPYRSAYSASKHALEAFIDTLRSELYDHPYINLCKVNPSYIYTNLSINAITSDGSNYGKMDQTTLNGMDPSYVAEKIIHAISTGKSEVSLFPILHKILMYLKYIVPIVYFFIMKQRAKKLH